MNSAIERRNLLHGNLKLLERFLRTMYEWFFIMLLVESCIHAFKPF